MKTPPLFGIWLILLNAGIVAKLFVMCRLSLSTSIELDVELLSPIQSLINLTFSEFIGLTLKSNF